MFAKLYEATSSRLFAVLLRLLIRRELAEEALQDSCVRILLKAASEPAYGSPTDGPTGPVLM